MPLAAWMLSRDDQSALRIIGRMIGTHSGNERYPMHTLESHTYFS